uniref:Uncharacterized protein n=1 Tax=Romanomermis culicivorax TaxID=13658 RepID=A0A915HPF1_ROMCU
MQSTQRYQMRGKFSFCSVRSEVTIGDFLENCSYPLRSKVDSQAEHFKLFAISSVPFRRKKQQRSPKHNKTNVFLQMGKFSLKQVQAKIMQLFAVHCSRAMTHLYWPSLKCSSTRTVNFVTWEPILYLVELMRVPFNIKSTVTADSLHLVMAQMHRTSTVDL